MKHHKRGADIALDSSKHGRGPEIAYHQPFFKQKLRSSDAL